MLAFFLHLVLTSQSHAADLAPNTSDLPPGTYRIFLLPDHDSFLPQYRRFIYQTEDGYFLVQNITDDVQRDFPDAGGTDYATSVKKIDFPSIYNLPFDPKAVDHYAATHDYDKVRRELLNPPFRFTFQDKMNPLNIMGEEKEFSTYLNPSDIWHRDSSLRAPLKTPLPFFSSGLVSNMLLLPFASIFVGQYFVLPIYAASKLLNVTGLSSRNLSVLTNQVAFYSFIGFVVVYAVASPATLRFFRPDILRKYIKGGRVLRALESVSLVAHSNRDRFALVGMVTGAALAYPASACAFLIGKIAGI